MGGVQNSRENSGGVVGSYFSGQNGNSREEGEGGGLREIPSVVEVWIFSGTTQYLGLGIRILF